jgi:phenylpyruvate tautomerase PptA (4-oxalocrotonate tautomerase family)
MPFLSIQSNTELTTEQTSELTARASALVSEQLGKPERYVMVTVEHNAAMRFAGSDAPLAYLELKSIGLPESITADTSRALCQLLAETADIDPERVYIEFSDAPRKMWGWNSDTF